MQSFSHYSSFKLTTGDKICKHITCLVFNNGTSDKIMIGTIEAMQVLMFREHVNTLTLGDIDVHQHIKYEGI